MGARRRQRLSYFRSCHCTHADGESDDPAAKSQVIAHAASSHRLPRLGVITPVTTVTIQPPR